MKKLIKFFKDEGGLVAIEYALIAVGIAVAIAVAITPIGNRLKVVFGDILKAIGG